MIDHEQKLIFLHIPKTGGKAIEKALFGVDPFVGSSCHRNISQMVSDIGAENWQQYLCFAVVRSPVARAVSWWASSQKYGRNEVPRKFSDFVKSLELGLIDGFRPQKDWLVHETVPPPKLLRFETLNRDWKRFTQQYGLRSGSLDLVNRSSRKQRARAAIDLRARKRLQFQLRPEIELVKQLLDGEPL